MTSCYLVISFSIDTLLGFLYVPPLFLRISVCSFSIFNSFVKGGSSANLYFIIFLFEDNVLCFVAISNVSTNENLLGNLGIDVNLSWILVFVRNIFSSRQLFWNLVLVFSSHDNVSPGLHSFLSVIANIVRNNLVLIQLNIYQEHVPIYTIVLKFWLVFLRILQGSVIISGSTSFISMKIWYRLSNDLESLLLFFKIFYIEITTLWSSVLSISM